MGSVTKDKYHKCTSICHPRSYTGVRWVEDEPMGKAPIVATSVQIPRTHILVISILKRLPGV